MTKAQGINAQNQNPHIFSRDGYRKLEEKIMKQRRNQGLHPMRIMLFCLSPPSRHENWKLAHIGSMSSYTFDIAREILERIVRYNFSLNNIMILYKLEISTTWLGKAPKVLSQMMVVMTYLQLQLDELSTLNVCVLQDQESTLTNILEALTTTILAHQVGVWKG